MKNRRNDPSVGSRVLLNFSQLEREAYRLFQSKNYSAARNEAKKLICINRNSAMGNYLLGAIEMQSGDIKSAEVYLKRCLKTSPKHFAASALLGNLLLSQSEYEGALSLYRNGLNIQPNNYGILFNAGQCLRALGRIEEATILNRQALSVKPDFVQAASELGKLLAKAGHYQEALNLCMRYSQKYPTAYEPRLSLGRIYRELGQFENAKEVLQEAIRLAPNNTIIPAEYALVLIESNELTQADAFLSKVKMNTTPALMMAMAELSARRGNYVSAITSMSAALAEQTAKGRDPNSYLKLASWHAANNDRVMAIKVLQEGLTLFQDRCPALIINLFYNHLCLCDWRDYKKQSIKILTHLQTHPPPQIEPFMALLIEDLSAFDLYNITSRYTQQFRRWTQRAVLLKSVTSTGRERLRIGYISADFHQHATAFLIASVFELHDKNQFEIFAYSYGPNEQSPTRFRLEEAVDHFVDIRDLSHTKAAQRIHDDEIDILVDLKGFTRLARPEILALRPSPLQVNWLGYPGTMAVDFMDYIIVDPTIVPADQASAYHEALAYMPYAYAPLDPRRDIAPIPLRSRALLPNNAFVFCCFNNPRKIVPMIFDRWCHLLQEIPDSVLWLFARQESVVNNLLQAARQRGVDHNRLIFAGRVSQSEHLARLTLADLVLDTLPYNAHTTTSDALFMGVPVLTCIGKTFAGRVAASLLTAAGLPDMVTTNLDEYVAKAKTLASSHEDLLAIRQRIHLAKSTMPYFNMESFTVNLEALFLRMWDRLAKGLKPELLPPMDVSN